MYRLLNPNFMQNLFSVKTLQKFIAYFTISFAFMLLIAFQVNSHISIESAGYPENHEAIYDDLAVQANLEDSVIDKTQNALNNYEVSLDYSLEDRDFSSSLPNNITKAKGTRKVTHENSATWSYGEDNYIYEAGRKSNNKSLQNEKQSVKSKVFPSYNLLASSDHQRINDRMISDVQNTFRSHGVQINQLHASGNYKSNGQPCTLSFPCSSDSYCVDS